MNMRYSIIDSVKGGSGKTCFALHLSLALADEQPSLYMDMDIQGSSIESILFNQNIVGKSTDAKWRDKKDPCGVNVKKLTDSTEWAIASKYFNSIIGDTYKVCDLISCLEFNTDASESGENIAEDGRAIALGSKKLIDMDMVIASPYYNDKEIFKGNQSIEVNVSVFRLKLYSFLKRVIDYKRNDGKVKKYNNIVFDMPPGGERYSDCLYGILLTEDNVPYRFKVKEKSVDVYHMTTLDSSHIYATIQRISNLYRAHSHINLDRINNIYIVINNTVNNDIDDVLRNRANQIVEKLNDVGLSDVIKGKISIIKLDFNKNYRDVVMSIGGDCFYGEKNTNCNFSSGAIKNIYDFIHYDPNDSDNKDMKCTLEGDEQWWLKKPEQETKTQK